MLPPNYQIRHVEPSQFDDIIALCRLVYPTETPYTREELDNHRRVFPQGQFAAVDVTSNELAGVHFTLRLRMLDFHIDDSWDVLTAGGSFLDHDPTGHTLYGADIMVHPTHQHHGLAHALTDATRGLVQQEHLWRMVGASRLPGYCQCCTSQSVQQYVEAVVRGQEFDPVLSLHLKDGWQVVRPIQGYLQHDEQSAGWAVVIQWVNPKCPPPPEVDLCRLPMRAVESPKTALEIG
jgi:GNAT superfamily N-acetyltransferase